MKLRSGAELGGGQHSPATSASTATPGAAASQTAQTEGDHQNSHGSKRDEDISSPKIQGECCAPDSTALSSELGEATGIQDKKKKRINKKQNKRKKNIPDKQASDNKPALTPAVLPSASIEQYKLGISVSKVNSEEASQQDIPQCESSGSRKKSAPVSQKKRIQSRNMSRNRPRGPPANRDNGIAANEEIDMWNKIIQDIRKAKEKNDKQKAIAEQITALNEKISREGNKPTLAEISQLDTWYRQVLKLSEEEKTILQEEPSDVIKNLGLLTALRSASEAETTISRAASLPKSSKHSFVRDSTASHAATTSNSALLPDKLNRVKGSAQRSSSVSSSGHNKDTRDSVPVKLEEGAEGAAKGTIAERSGQFVVGAEVVFKHNKNRQGVEGEGIQCIIKSISGEGYKKRYDVQDPEPNENGEQGAVYKTSAASLIPIPQIGSVLPSFPVGKQVLARYPDTTTFYCAEVMGSKKDVYRLKFEGEEDDKEMEVDRRFVLDIPSK